MTNLLGHGPRSRGCLACAVVATLMVMAFPYPQRSDAQSLATDTSDTGVSEASSSTGESTNLLGALRVPSGFVVSVAAEAPLVKHPMMASFDHRGRLYIAESAGLNLATADLEQQLPNFIRRLEDVDGDGVFDRSTIFANNMTLPQGALWHQGSLYVASPPYIWKLTDTNDDGVADRREKLVSKFGYTGNAASVHGCFLGPEGRIYWCDGRHGHEFKDDQGKVTSKKSGSYIFSCRPDGADVRIHCGGGMDNPVEVDFTERGEMIGTVNILYSRPRDDCLVHWLFGGAYPHSTRVLSELRRTGPLLGPIHRFGHVAVSGMTRYRSGWLAPEFRDDMFVTIFNTGKVQRVTLQREGASFRTELREFLTSSNRDFHPTDVLEDADGSLLVIDTGGWFLKGCPTSQLAKPKVTGAIYRIRPQGRQAVADPRGQLIKWDRLLRRQLVDLLADQRFVVRQRAIEQVGRSTDRQLLELALSEKEPVVRRNAVWAMARRDGVEDRLLLRALEDEQASIRHAACLVIGERRCQAAKAKLITVLGHDKDMAVQREAAKALGRLGDPSAIKPLMLAINRSAKLASDVVDRAREHAVIFAIGQLAADHPTELVPWLEPHVDPERRRAALIVLDQMGSTLLTPNRVVAALNSPYARLQDVATEIFSSRQSWLKNAQEYFDVDRLLEDLGHQRRKLLARLCADRSVVERIVARLKTHPDQRQALTTILNSASSVAKSDSLLTNVARWLETDATAAWRRQLIQLAGKLRDAKLASSLQQLIQDRRQPVAIRLLAMSSLQQSDRRLPAASFELLVSSLTRDDASGERLQAATICGNASLTSEQQLQLARLLKSAGPQELRELLRSFARASKDSVRIALLENLGAAKSFRTLPMSEFSDVVKRYPESLLPRANRLLDQLKSRDNQRRLGVERILATLPVGDAVNGRKVFFAEKSKCATCHVLPAPTTTAGKQAIAIGPDLSRIGRIRSRRDLVEAILYPSASIVRDYEPYRVALTDGRVLNGLMVGEDDLAIQLQQATGKPVRVLRSQIDVAQPSAVSLMPRGFEETLHRQDLADLVAFLLSLK